MYLFLLILFRTVRLVRRAQGYGVAHRARVGSEETSLAIPVRGKDRILATSLTAAELLSLAR